MDEMVLSSLNKRDPFLEPSCCHMGGIGLFEKHLADLIQLLHVCTRCFRFVDGIICRIRPT